MLRKANSDTILTPLVALSLHTSAVLVIQTQTTCHIFTPPPLLQMLTLTPPSATVPTTTRDHTHTLRHPPARSLELVPSENIPCPSRLTRPPRGHHTFTQKCSPAPLTTTHHYCASLLPLPPYTQSCPQTNPQCHPHPAPAVALTTAPPTTPYSASLRPQRHALPHSARHTCTRPLLVAAATTGRSGCGAMRDGMAVISSLLRSHT